MNKKFCLPTTANKSPNKKLRKLTFEKDQIFIAPFLKNKSEASEEKNDKNSDLVYIPFYTPYKAEKSHC